MGAWLISNWCEIGDDELITASFSLTLCQQASLVAASMSRPVDGWSALTQWADCLGQLERPKPIPDEAHIIRRRLTVLLQRNPQVTALSTRIASAPIRELPLLIRELNGSELPQWIDRNMTPEMVLFLRRQADSMTVLLSGGESDSLMGMMVTAKGPKDYFNEGYALQQAGKTQEAQNAYRKVFEVDPDVTDSDTHVLACLNMGIIYLLEQNSADAAYVLKRGVELNPDRLDVRNNYAVSLLALNRHFAAIHQWSIALNKVQVMAVADPKVEGIAEDITRMLRQLVDQTSGHGEYDIALTAVEALLKNDPGNPELKKLENELQANLARSSFEQAGPKRFDRGDLIALSKKTANMLRHSPSFFELELDEDGWVPMDQFIAALHLRPRWVYVDRAVLAEMIATVSEGRYEIQGDKIRAVYGHTIPGRFKKEPAIPPEILYHGTDRKFFPQILRDGLRPMKRQYVHLSATREKAAQVGHRKGENMIILVVQTAALLDQGIQFYQGSDQVWLTDELPPEALEIEEEGT